MIQNSYYFYIFAVETIIKMKNRIEYIDIAKGIGIILVVCSHTDALGWMWLFMGMFVPIFYFCSGYTYTRKMSFKESMKRQFVKLLVPYIFFNVLLFLVFGHFSLRELVGIFYSRYCLFPLYNTPNLKFLTSGNYPLWFLTSMFVTYFLFYIIVYHERFKYYFLSCYAILAMAFTMSPVLLPWSIDTAPLTALIMYTGLEVRRRELLSINVWQILILALLYIGLQCYGGDINLSVRMYGNSISLYFVMAAIGSFIVLYCSKFLQGSLVGIILMALGRHSMTIFCVEMAFIVWTKDVLRWVSPNSELNEVAGIFEIIVALIGGYLLSVLLHKNRLLRRITYGS